MGSRQLQNGNRLPEEPSMWWEGWNTFHALPLTNANDLTNSFLGNGTSTETPKQRGLESFWMVNIWRYWEGAGPREDKKTSHTLPYASLLFGCFWVVSFILKQTPINVIKVFFPRSVSYASQFSNGGVLRTPKFVAKYRWPRTCNWHLQWWQVLWNWAL